MAFITLSSSSTGARRTAAAVVVACLSTAPAYAQLDPTLFLKRTPPNVLFVVDTATRMQSDAPTDPSNPAATSSYYDPFVYAHNLLQSTQEGELGLNAANMTSQYRRKYSGLTYASGGSDKYNANTIVAIGDLASTFATFAAPTRMSIARAAIYQAVKQNAIVAHFGLIKMRQNSPAMPATQGNSGPVDDIDTSQSIGDWGGGSLQRWGLTRPTVGSNNGSAGSNTAVVIKADSGTANTDILTVLSKKPTDAPTGSLSPLIPAGNDDANTIDAPINNMLVDAQTEAARLLKNDPNCTSTVLVLVTGGGEGTTAGSPDPSATAATILNSVAGRHIPIYVVAIAPPSSDVAQLQNIAAKSGGQYFEITKAQIDAALGSTMWSAAVTGAPSGTVVVPEAVRAMNTAIQAAFENFADLNTAALIATPLPAGVPSIIPTSDFQVSAPIIGTVNLQNAKDANGNTLSPDPSTVKDRAGNVIPERSNVMVTSAFTLPSFDGRIRAYRVYQPVADSTQPTGWKFVSDGTPLWVAQTPVAASRNLYTTLADGTMIQFTAANAAQLAPLMNLNVTDATNVINVVRAQPFGTILDSTPAIMNPPSLDPPPDDTYPAFATSNKDRRSIVFVGTNRGILEGIDARTGLEVWGYIPMNLLPKLRTLWDGQAVGSTDFMMDGSPKIADIKFADGSWHTMMFLGEGAGGTFYQTLDVTLANMASSLSPTTDDPNALLTYFSNPTIIPVKWSFPLLTHWDPTISTTMMPYGDLSASATNIEKTVGQTWSDPAIGQVVNTTSPYVMLVGSGYLPYSTQLQPNRTGIVAGTTFYMLRAETGALIDSRNVFSDGQYENQDNCVTSNDCTKFKNALQSDPVATGPSDSRFITMAYIGDLDGRIWRFDITLGGSTPAFVSSAMNPTKLYDDPLKQPIFSSMATVNVGGTQQYIFAGTGSDLLPANGVSTQYKLIGVLDNGTTGTKTFEIDLTKVDGTSGDEKVTAFPAVAGDIVFFTTTTFNPAAPCTLPTASLYALTFIGGPAYDTNNDGKFNGSDSVLVKSVAGVRATAPFIVDQHLAFGAGGKVQLFGDMSDFNNGIGQAGVRILSWREDR